MEAGREQSVPRLMKVRRVVDMSRPELPMERLRILNLPCIMSRYLTTYVFILIVTFRSGAGHGAAQHLARNSTQSGKSEFSCLAFGGLLNSGSPFACHNS